MQKIYMIYAEADGFTFVFHGFSTPVAGSRFKRPTFLTGYCSWGNLYPKEYKRLGTAKKIAGKCRMMMGNSTMYHTGRDFYILERTFGDDGKLEGEKRIDLE